MNSNVSGEIVLVLIILGIFLLLVYAAGNSAPQRYPVNIIEPVTVQSVNYASLVEWDINEGDPSHWAAPSYLDGDTVRMEHGDVDKSREVIAGKTFSYRIPVQPNDRVTFQVYLKTGESSIGDANAYSGVRCGIDFYSSDGYITGVASQYVNWGTDWTLRTLDFKVQLQYVSDGWLGGEAGVLETPSAIIPWVQVWSDVHGNLDYGIAWFTNATLNVNS